jgi:parvulin-like peptidyl-prolyl isomerase
MNGGNLLKRTFFVCCALLFTLALSGCEKKPVAVVGGEKISEKVLNWHVRESMREHGEKGIQVASASIRSSVIEQLVSRKLLALGAKKQGMTVSDAEVGREVENRTERMGKKDLMRALRECSLTEKEHWEIVREEILTDKFVRSMIPEDALTEENIKKFYKKSPTPFLMPETVLVRFAHFREKAAAEEMLRDIKKSSFDEVADGLGTGNDYSVSGYGWTALDVYSPNISRPLKKLKAGEHGGPYKGGKGYFVFRIKERKKERIKSLDEAREEIRTLLIGRMRESAAVHWVAKRKKSTEILTN